MGSASKPIPHLATEGFLDKRELAALLNVSVSTINKWVSRRRGPVFVKLGTLVRFAPSDVQAFVAARRKK